MFSPRTSVTAVLAIAAVSLTAACAAEPETTDENVGQTAQAYTTGVSEICATAHSGSNSGTNNSVTIGYYGTDLYECELPNGIGTGKTACCTPTSTRRIPDKIAITFSYSGFVVYYTNSSANTDGLRVSSMSAKGTDSVSSGWSVSAGTFTNILDNKNVSCEGCTLGTFCNSCWIDRDDHKKCTGLQISRSGFQQAGDNAVYCIDDL